MAQDFYAAFHVGADNKHITEIDEAGVAFAAIQGLNQKLEDEVRTQQEEISSLRAALAAERAEVQAIKASMARLAPERQDLARR